jgi:pectin lyase
MLAPESGADAGAAGAPMTGNRLVALAGGKVEAFVNGKALAASAEPGSLLQSEVSLAEGANVVVLRVTGAASGSFALAELSGPFGKLITSRRWRVKRADAAEATDVAPAFARVDYDDSRWELASPSDGALPSAFPQDSAAARVGTSAPAEVLLVRVRFFVPAGYRADKPQGFGRGVTGGAGGQVVRVQTREELARALCAKSSGNRCTDDEKRIIEVPSQVFDFTGTEGTRSEAGCIVKECSGGAASEHILNRQNWCGTKPLFNITYDVAGTTPLMVGSNKTVIGIGPHATLRGKGLTLRGGVRNIIVRNLTITDLNPQIVWGGDAITIDDADGVWIDHNRIARIGRQMLVTGFGKASNVTFSWNELDGKTPYSASCDGAHYWAMLILGANDTITLQSNWLHDISGRAPHAGGMMNATNALHMVNNHFDHVPGHALEPLTSGAHLLLEGNYFEQVARPIETASDPGYVFAPVTGSSTPACGTAIGRECEPNVLAPAPQGSPGLPRDAAALTYVARDKAALVQPYAAIEVPASVPFFAGPGH